METNTLIKTEKMKMLANEHYEHLDSELTKEREEAADLTWLFNQTRDSEIEERTTILSKLLGRMGEGCEIKAPFKCDYGYNIELGDRVFMNYGCIILDCNKISIGDDTLFAPGVQITAAYHPTEPDLRLQKLEAADEVNIGRNVWIGAGAVICPGVTIGDNTTIAAGSVVVKDIPANVVAAGVPCKPVKDV